MNIDPDVSEEELRTLFDNFGTVEKLRVIRKPDESDKYRAIVGFKTAEVAMLAWKEFRGMKIGNEKMYICQGIHQPFLFDSEKHPMVPLVFVGGLRNHVRNLEIRRAFYKCGNVLNVRRSMRFPKNRMAAPTYILFEKLDSAIAACLTMSQQTIKGDRVQVNMFASNVSGREDPSAFALIRKYADSRNGGGDDRRRRRRSSSSEDGDRDHSAGRDSSSSERVVRVSHKRRSSVGRNDRRGKRPRRGRRESSSSSRGSRSRSRSRSSTRSRSRSRSKSKSRSRSGDRSDKGRQSEAMTIFDDDDVDRLRRRSSQRSDGGGEPSSRSQKRFSGDKYASSTRYAKMC